MKDTNQDTKVLVDITKKEKDKERQSAIYPIILSEYNSAWAEWCSEYKASLARLIGLENIERISRFGRTDVPELMAKPTVGIPIEIRKNQYR
jgi:hypothetical protein